MSIGLFEIAILLFIVFVLLGPKRIQNLLSALGRGVKDFTTEFGKNEDHKELPRGDSKDKPRKK